jgi:hypothetical protein
VFGCASARRLSAITHARRDRPRRATQHFGQRIGQAVTGVDSRPGGSHRFKVTLANQLRAELELFWPGPIGLFNDVDSRISLALLQRYPSPDDARLLGEKRLAAFLKTQNSNNRKTPGELFKRLRRAAAGHAGEAETCSRRQVMLALVTALGVAPQPFHGGLSGVGLARVAGSGPRRAALAARKRLRDVGAQVVDHESDAAHREVVVCQRSSS